MTLGALAAWFLLGHLGLIAVLVYVWITAMSTTNTAKARSTEHRVDGLVTAAANTNTSVAQLNRGTFTNVAGGSTIQLDTQQGSATLHCGALSNFTSGSQTTFLATLTQIGPRGDLNVSTPGGANSAWYNDVAGLLDGLRDGLVNHKFMAS